MVSCVIVWLCVKANNEHYIQHEFNSITNFLELATEGSLAFVVMCTYIYIIYEEETEILGKG